MPRKKKAGPDTAIVKTETTLPSTDFVKVEKNLNSLGFFTPSSKSIRGAKAKTITFPRMVEGKKVQAKVTIAPVALYGLPVTADQDKYMALQKIITDIKQERGRVSNPIGFTSAEILRLLGHADSGKNFHDIHEWVKRMTSTTIISEGAVYLAGRKKWARDMFHVFDRSVAAGEELEDGSVSDRHYVWLSDWQLENINNNHLLPIDFETYKKLKSHISKALVPMLQVWLFASLEKGSCEKRYDELCQYLNVSQYQHLSKIKEKLGPALDELKSHGYISKWKIEPTSDKKSFKIVLHHGEKFHRDRRQRLGQGDGDLGQMSSQLLVGAKEESIETPPPERAQEDSMLIDKLMNFGIDGGRAARLVENNREECALWAEAWPHQNQKGMENPPAVLIRFIETTRRPLPTGYRDAIEQEQRRKEYEQQQARQMAEELYFRYFAPAFYSHLKQELLEIQSTRPDEYRVFREDFDKEHAENLRMIESEEHREEVTIRKAMEFFHRIRPGLGVRLTTFDEWDDAENREKSDPVEWFNSHPEAVDKLLS